MARLITMGFDFENLLDILTVFLFLILKKRRSNQIFKTISFADNQRLRKWRTDRTFENTRQFEEENLVSFHW